jgi:hypothetical protein
MNSSLPYFSQWGDIVCNELVERGEDPSSIFEWSRDGFATREDYLFWSRRICGLACLQSLLHGWEIDNLDMCTLIGLAGKSGALWRDNKEEKVHGLFYRPFLRWIADQFGLDGRVIENCKVAELVSPISDGIVAMASVSSEIRYPEQPNVRRGGHLVLVYGRAGKTLLFHNPPGVPPRAQAVRLDMSIFERFFAERGMIIRRPQ